MGSEPPLQETCKSLLRISCERSRKHLEKLLKAEDEVELPMIDLNGLKMGCRERDKCLKEIAEAARKWGFFQVTNHGISKEVLGSMKNEQKKVFDEPFEKKVEDDFLNLPSNSYRWGNPEATCLEQFSWSEAFHISLADISRLDGYRANLRSKIEAFTRSAATLAQTLAEVLAENIGVKTSYFKENCVPNTSFLRMNRYLPCPFSFQVCGLVAHTDSDFLTILYQDQTGGLQLKKDGRWVRVVPNPEALIINIGDLFQAFSNNIYRNAEHRVVAPHQVDRYSVAYFYCPSNDAVIQSCGKPGIYRKFTFGEYKQQIQKDLQATGCKVGLSRFLM